MTKVIYLNKEELDLMSREEILIHHDQFITDCDNFKTNADANQYTDEIMFYCDIRFKEAKIEMQNRWKEQGHHELMDNEALYKLGLSTNLPENGEFKFIKGIDIPKDIDIDAMINFNKVFNKK